MKWLLTGTLFILVHIAEHHSTFSTNLDRNYPVVLTHVLMNRGESLMNLPIAKSRDDLIDQDLPPWNPTGIEQITNEGIRSQFEVGKWLRQRYLKLLQTRYWKPDIYTLSADTDSCISSAQATMAGIFPPSGNDVWIQGLDWQPTPVHTLTTFADNKLLLRVHCPSEPGEEKILNAGFSEDAHFQKRLDSMLSFLSYSMGYQIHKSYIPTIVQSLETQEKYNLTLPKWSHILYPHPLKRVRKKLFTHPTVSEQTKKFKSGSLLNDIVTHIDEKVSEVLKPDRKMWLYSGEDNFIVSMMNTLNLNMTKSPPRFSDLLLLELRQQDNPRHYYVTVSYKRGDEDKEIKLKMRECEMLCPLDEFKNIIETYLVSDWNEDCRASQSAASQDTLNSVISLLGLVLVLMQVLKR